MKYKCPLIAVSDLETSKAFYKAVLGLDVVLDFGANVTLSGGINLQQAESWALLLEKKPAEIIFGGCDAELYFEEDDFSSFAEALSRIAGICYVHKTKEHPWGQRAVRFYDPDMHIIEVGESLNAVALRFYNEGMTIAQIAKRMDVSPGYVCELLGEQSTGKSNIR